MKNKEYTFVCAINELEQPIPFLSSLDDRFRLVDYNISYQISYIKCIL